MAVGDMFLKLTDIDGESTVDGHEGEIDVDSCSFGFTNLAALSDGQQHFQIGDHVAAG